MLKQDEPLQTESQLGRSVSDGARHRTSHGRSVWGAGTAEGRQRWRQSGYLGAVVVNAMLMVIAHSLLSWPVPFITPAWADVLWAIDLSLSGTMVANAVFISYDEPWFRDLMQIALTVLSLVAWLTLAQVFPFDFGDPGANELARLIGAMVGFALAIALLVQAIVWIADRMRHALR